VSGQEEYSVARWLAEIEAELTSAWEGGLLPVIVGGTGLYFKALQQGLADVPPIPAHIREKWRSYKGDLAHELASRDPISAASLNPGDRQRLARALEVIESTGKPLRYWQRQSERRAPLTGVVTERVFLDVPRQILYERAEHRFDRMIAAGAIDEVRPLIGLSPDLPMMRAIGLPELRDYLMGKQALSAAIEAAKAATRQYIKRQFTWWRGQMTGWSVAGSNNELLHAREDR
jgi:tRNA dimethylallyltransferase